MKTNLLISRSRLAQNFGAVQRVAGAEATVLAVVKADAYGHGAALCAPVLEAAGATWFGVGDAEEGAAVRAALRTSTARVMVMCGMEPEDAPAMLAHRLTPVVWTLEHVAAMERAAGAAGQQAVVHLKIDSGMSRQGAQGGEPLRAVLTRLANSPWLTCEGVLTHLASAEESGSAQTALQQERFAAALTEVLAAGFRPEWIHLANTSALDEGSTAAWLRALAQTSASEGYAPRVMVRTGLALYGHCVPLDVCAQPGSATPDPGHLELEHPNFLPQPHPASPVAPHLAPHLQPVLRWTTRVIGLRDVPAGEHVGYGGTWTARQPKRLALLPVGYADGLRRGASSGMGDGWVMFGEHRAPVAGRVSMNLTTVDVTGVPDVHEGAEVTLLGTGVSAGDHARWNGTIPYEILCGLRGHRALG